eukprot:468226-Heterocapsa_arctica.AAC.1
MGHCAFSVLIDRSSLAVFGTVYKFIRARYHTPSVLWPSVRKELEAFLALLPLLVHEWDSPWSEE